MPFKRLFFGLWSVVLLFAVILTGIFAGDFMREYAKDVLLVICLYSVGRVLFPQKPRFMSAIAFGTAFVFELLQLTPLHGFLSRKSEVLGVISGGTFSFKELICCAVGGVICAVIDIFIVGKSKKISG